MNAKQILKILKLRANPKNIKGMAQFGMTAKKRLGVSVPNMRKIAKETNKNHSLAIQLWKTGIKEAKIVASMVGEPEKVTEKQMEAWVKDFDSWDVCDQVISNLFDKTKFAYQKAFEWSKRKEEFVKRAGFVLMATLSVHDKKANNKKFEQFFPLIKKEAIDERNFVKKAVNWALRQIGKRNLALNKKAIAIAKEIQKIDSKSAKWIANDALRELTGEAVQKRLRAKK